MIGSSARLLQLLGLLQSRRDWSGAELADQLAVTERTVRRDVDRLRELGYTVDADRGTGGGYRLGHGTGMPPLLLTADEAVAVAVALRTTASSGISEIEQTAIAAPLKLEQSLPAPLRRRIETVGRAVLSISGPGPVVDIDTLVTVAAAVRDHQQLGVDYTTHRGAVLHRTLEPHRLVRVADRWYVDAWDVEAGGWRNYRLDRLTPRLPLGRRFVPAERSDADLEADLSAGITTRAYRFTLRMTVSAPAASVGDKVGPTRGQVRAIDAQQCEVVGGGNDLDAMALWILGLGFDVVVSEPRALRPHLEALATRCAAAGSAL